MGTAGTIRGTVAWSVPRLVPRLVPAAKMAVAAVVAWSVARLFDDTQSFIAAYAAVFMVAGTVYRSLLDAARQVTTVVLGVLVAFVAVLVIPWPPAKLGVAVFAGMMLGSWRRLGPDGIWVGVVALLMVTFGTADDVSYLALRVGEAVFGAVVGIAVNALVAPPLRLRAGGRAVAALSADLANLLTAAAAGLRGGWAEDDARGWRRSACQLEVAARHAENEIGHGHESLRLNSRRRRRTGLAHPSVEDRRLSVLRALVRHTQQLTETLAASAEPASTLPATGTTFDARLADPVDTLAEAVRAYRDPHSHRLDRDALTTALAHARDRRAAMARIVPSPDLDPPKDWSTHAAALVAVERALRTLTDAPDPADTR